MAFSTVLTVLLFLILFIITVGAQHRYARQGYPRSWRWKGVLFVTAALSIYVFLSILTLLEASSETRQNSWLVTQSIRLAVACLFGIGFAWFLPYKFRWVFPKR